MPSDEERLRVFLEGDYGRVLGTVAVVVRDRALAEDLVHEAIARAWEHRADRIEHLDRWVLVVALNLARSRWRRLRRSQQVAAPTWVSPDADASTAEWRMVLEGLPHRQQQVAVLHYIEDLSVRDIATATGTSEGAVKNALFNARRALAALLTSVEVEETPR